MKVLPTYKYWGVFLIQSIIIIILLLLADVGIYTKGILVVIYLLLCAVLLLLFYVRKYKENMAGQNEYIVSSQNAGEIFENMESLLEQIQDNGNERMRSQILRTQAELYSLQRQINPHFIYNTLETIRGQALKCNEREIAKMIELLARVFRYNISTNDQFVTLEDELQHIDNYIAIQNYRFGGKIVLKKKIDEDSKELASYAIPFLVLQPLVENAVYHGIETKMGIGTITIKVVVTEFHLFIRVSDDGVGMDPEELQILNQKIRAAEQGEMQYQKRERHTGIALVNVHQRVQLFYGQDYGLRILSKKGVGTTVELTLPKRGEAS